MNKKGILTVVSGFSGAGKGTIMKELLKKYDNYALSISATTRQPREGEVDGREYFFKSREDFENMIAKEELIEYAKYVDNYYGTPRQYVEEQLSNGKDVILEIEIQGALKVKEKFPDKNIFADDEDIPNMPSKGRDGREPRDPTIDDIIKQLSKLKGEAKRGAVDGLTDLVKKNKNESLAEAFSKGIREFSDKE